METARTPFAPREWLRRASRLVPAKDLAGFAPTAVLARKLFGRGARDDAEARAALAHPGDDPGERDEAFVELVVDLFRAVGERYFRFRVEGVENVPASGPALLVGNHNGGMQFTDAFLTFVAVWDAFGPARVVNGLAHDLVFGDPVLGRYAARFGVLRADHRGAHRGLDAGNLVLVYPGSELDTFRPWTARNRVELGGRKGFVRLALRAGVPVVPVVSVGTHEQFVVLSRGDGLARRLGLKKLLRAQVLPVTLSIPWGLGFGFLPYVPIPAQTTLAFGAPLSWKDLGPHAAEDPAVVARCFAEVEAAMQALLDDLARDRTPFLGRARDQGRVRGRERARG